MRVSKDGGVTRGRGSEPRSCPAATVPHSDAVIFPDRRLCTKLTSEVSISVH